MGSILKRLFPNRRHMIFALSDIPPGEGGAPPEAIQVLPYGLVKSAKGAFLVDDVSVQEILAARGQRMNELVIDFEHQTLTGDEAPAAGWIGAFENRGADGIWAKVQWTPRAIEYLKNREYRYLSPVVLVRDGDNRAVEILNAALTNAPAIDGMVPVVNKRTVREEGRTDEVNLQELKTMLKLSENATEEEITQHLQHLMSASGQHAAILKALGLGADSTSEQLQAKLAELKPAAVGGTPAGTEVYASKADVDKLAALVLGLSQGRTENMVLQALKDGKISPAQKAWAEKYAAADPEGFRTYVNSAPVVVPIGQRIVDIEPQEIKPDDMQLSVNRALGIDVETYKKFGPARAD